MNTYKCPKCDGEDVSVLVRISCRPTEYGVEVHGDAIKEHDDFACCNECEWEGVMGNLVLGPALDE